MGEPQLGHSIGQTSGLVRIHRIRATRGHITKRASPGADPTEDHHRGVAF
jgi:hypothetical protein